MTKPKTIFALSTPAGKSAIAVVRVSGKDAFSAINKISTSMPKKEKQSKINKIIDENGKTIDQTITTFFKKPKSYTGENMVEISLHGGASTTNKLIELLLKNKNLRMAERGEFTRRAFDNNKLDLIQVEAVSDLINSETEIQRRQAINNLEGALSDKTKKIYDDLKKLLANIEAIIDFSDEDLPSNIYLDIKEQKKNILKKLKKIIKNSEVGKKIRNGFVVGIVGKTNVGKSSFINKISNQEIAIVTNEHGTTRDILESYIDLKGLPVRFYDTAGIRKSNNKIEKIGIEKSIKISERSDLNLVFIEKISEISYFKKIPNKIYIQSKLDLRKKPIKKRKVFNISSKNGKGIKPLLSKISSYLRKKGIIENVFISRERQKNHIKNSIKIIENSLNNKNYDIMAEDIRSSLSEISKIHGNVDIEDILDIIFDDFCIGK